MSNIDFLIAEVSNAKITFSQRGATDFPKELFGSQTIVQSPKTGKCNIRDHLTFPVTLTAKLHF